MIHSEWQLLQQYHDQNRLPHALLVSGRSEFERKAFAERAAQFILCTSLDSLQKPCGHCRSCHLFQVGSHPVFV